MIIDCDRCQVRGDACRNCVVGVFLDLPRRPSEPTNPEGRPSGAQSVQLDASELRALAVLADEGLVPRLRLVSTEPRQTSLTSPVEADLSDVG